jgi:DNA-binding NtrC family response regulator
MRGIMHWLRKNKTLAEVSLRPPTEVLSKIAKILVIDDDPNSFPLKPLQSEGYHIEQWATVQDIGSLERGEFDVVFLDVKGVAGHWSTEDGIAVLQHVKAVNPTQVIVAFSAHTFDLSKSSFWKLADDTLRKPVDALRCKQIIDNLLVSTFTFEHLWDGMSK